jgi:hypothetical protein
MLFFTDQNEVVPHDLHSLVPESSSYKAVTTTYGLSSLIDNPA